MCSFESPLTKLPRLRVHERNLLNARVVITTLYLAAATPIKVCLCYRETGSGFGGRPFAT